MGLEKSSLDLQIESPPSPICRGLAEFQDLYKSPRVTFTSWEDFHLWWKILELLISSEQQDTQHFGIFAVRHVVQQRPNIWYTEQFSILYEYQEHLTAFKSHSRAITAGFFGCVYVRALFTSVEIQLWGNRAVQCIQLLHFSIILGKCLGREKRLNYKGWKV